MNATGQDAVRFRDVLAAHFSPEEIYDLLWRFGLSGTVPLSSSLDGLATHAADTLVRHGKLDEAIAHVLHSRPGTIPLLQSKEKAPRDAELLAEELATAVAGLPDAGTSDGRKTILWRLGIPEHAIDLNGSGHEFAYRLLRYIDSHPRYHYDALLDHLIEEEHT